MAGMRALLKSDVREGTIFVMYTSGSSGNGMGSKLVKFTLNRSGSASSF